MSLLSIFRKTAPIANAALTLYNPMLGAVVNQILLAESVIPGEQKGTEKKQFVLNSLAGMAPLLIPLIEQTLGKDVIDDEQFTTAVSDLIDAVVKLLNSVKGLQPK